MCHKDEKKNIYVRPEYESQNQPNYENSATYGQ